MVHVGVSALQLAYQVLVLCSTGLLVRRLTARHRIALPADPVSGVLLLFPHAIEVGGLISMPLPNQRRVD